MKTLVLSTAVGLTLLAVSTAQAGHPIARARVANHRHAKAATRYNATEIFHAKIATRKANVDAVRSSRVQAFENLQTNVVDLADQIRGARFALSVIGDIKGEHPLGYDGVDGERPIDYDGIDGEHPLDFEGVDGEHPLEYEGIDGEVPLPIFWWLF